MIIIIQNFTLVNLTSTVTPHPVKLPLRAAVPCLPMHSSPYKLVSLHTGLPTHLSPYALVSLRIRLPTHSTSHNGEEGWRGRMTRKDQHLSEIVHWSRHAVCYSRLLQYTVRKLSYRLDAIDTLPLYGSQPRHQYWSE